MPSNFFNQARGDGRRLFQGYEDGCLEKHNKVYHLTLMFRLLKGVKGKVYGRD